MSNFVDTAFRRLTSSQKEEMISHFLGLYWDEHKINLLANKSFIRETVDSYLKVDRGKTIAESRSFIELHFSQDIQRLLKNIIITEEQKINLLDSIYSQVWYLTPGDNYFKDTGIRQISLFKRAHKNKKDYIDVPLNIMKEK